MKRSGTSLFGLREALRYLRTKTAVAEEVQEDSGFGFWNGLKRMVQSALPDCNPDYAFEDVRVWLIEFDKDGDPGREIGLDSHDVPVLAGPDERNYGFWLDTRMKLDDFNGEAISAEAFEATWSAWQDR